MTVLLLHRRSNHAIHAMIGEIGPKLGCLGLYIRSKQWPKSELYSRTPLVIHITKLLFLDESKNTNIYWNTLGYKSKTYERFLEFRLLYFDSFYSLSRTTALLRCSTFDFNNWVFEIKLILYASADHLPERTFQRNLIFLNRLWDIVFAALSKVLLPCVHMLDYFSGHHFKEHHQYWRAT